MDVETRRRRAAAYQEQGWTYARIAKRFAISQSTAYYLLNPEKRVQPEKTVALRKVYWAQLRARGVESGMSVAVELERLLVGETPRLERVESNGKGGRES